MSHAQADEYRRRATHLRTLASRLTHTPSMNLQTHSTVDTWRGPRAQQCSQDLATAQRAVHLAIDDLADRAWRFERLADDLDAAALRADLIAAAEAEARRAAGRADTSP